jgi:membrane fusion protein, multidrug efflux system
MFHSACWRQTVTAQAPPPTVVVMEAVAADVLIFSEFAAQTYARAMVEVRGHVEGYIEKWNFCPAAEVTAGQTLYVLDLRPYTAAVQQAKGNLHHAGGFERRFAVRRKLTTSQAWSPYSQS